jgi:cytochrome c556
MRRFAVCACTVLAVGLTLTLAAGPPDDSESISDIMKALHKGAQSPLAQLKTALKAETPDWTAIQDAAKVYAKHAPDLPKNDAPKGDSAAYKKLAEAFASSAEKLGTAAEKKNVADARSAFDTLAKSCMECHKAHKP